MYASSNSVRSVKMERRASSNGDFCTRSDPLPTVPCTPYLLLNRLASDLLGLDGRYVVNKVDDDSLKLRSGGPLYRRTPRAVLSYR
jgi:hypothetical protein